MEPLFKLSEILEELNSLIKHYNEEAMKHEMDSELFKLWSTQATGIANAKQHLQRTYGVK